MTELLSNPAHSDPSMLPLPSAPSIHRVSSPPRGPSRRPPRDLPHALLRARRFAFAPLLALACVLGCGKPVTPAEAPPPPPPDRPPTPKSVTKDNPGGDAPDPEKAALLRLLNEPFVGRRRDRWSTLAVPLADWKNWRRIKIWGHPTRATFQYGKEHTALLTLRYSPIEGPNDPERCLADFMKYASPIAESYGVRLGQSQLVKTTQQVRAEQRPVLVRLQEGGVESIVVSDDYVGFMAAYQSWPGTCLVQSFAVVSTNHPDIATKVRDRWVSEAVGKLAWDKKLTEAPDPSLVR